MIHLASSLIGEKLITLEHAAKSFPGNRGRHTHISTVYRWANSGIRGVRLETMVVGGRRYTSEEAIARFIDILSASATDACPTLRSPASRQRGYDQAGKELDREGL